MFGGAYSDFLMFFFLVGGLVDYVGFADLVLGRALDFDIRGSRLEVVIIPVV